MTILDIPFSYQAEGVLIGKRKRNLYNIVSNTNVKIENVEKEELSLMAVSMINQNNIFAIPYYEYNGELYTPLLNGNDFSEFSDNNHKIKGYILESLERCNLQNKITLDTLSVLTGMCLEKYNQPYNEDKKIENYIIGLDEKCNLVEEQDLKIIYSQNYEFQEKLVHNLKDDIINVNGELMCKSTGPLYAHYEKNNEKIINIHPNLFYKHNELFDIRNEKTLISLQSRSFYGNNLLFGISSLLFPIQGEDIQNKIDNIKENKHIDIYGRNQITMQGIIFDYEKLFNITKKHFGRVIFDNTLGFAMSKNLRFYQNGKPIPETEKSIFFKFLSDEFPTSQDWIKKYNQCIESNFDFKVVMETLKSVNIFLNEEKRINKALYFEDMTKYLDSPIQHKNLVRNMIPSISFVLKNSKNFLSSLDENYQYYYDYGIETPDTMIFQKDSFHQDNLDIIKNDNVLKI